MPRIRFVSDLHFEFHKDDGASFVASFVSSLDPDGVDAKVGATRVVCNPFGYVRIEENPAFDEAMTIDL